MKKALLWVMLLLFCFPSFSQLLTRSHEFPVESTTAFEINMDGSGVIRVLDQYTQFSVYVHPVLAINCSRSSVNPFSHQGMGSSKFGSLAIIFYP